MPPPHFSDHNETRLAVALVLLFLLLVWGGVAFAIVLLL